MLIVWDEVGTTFEGGILTVQRRAMLFRNESSRRTKAEMGDGPNVPIHFRRVNKLKTLERDSSLYWYVCMLSPEL